MWNRTESTQFPVRTIFVKSLETIFRDLLLLLLNCLQGKKRKLKGQNDPKRNDVQVLIRLAQTHVNYFTSEINLFYKV